MKRIFLTASMLLLVAGMLRAEQVPTSVTRQVALNFWNTYHTENVKSMTSADLVLGTGYGLSGMDIYRVADQGFVIVAKDNSVHPVLGYSFDSPIPDTLNATLRYWLGGYEAQIAEAMRKQVEPTPEVADEWDGLVNDPVPPVPMMIMDVPAMLTTLWDQGDPFNMFCPFDNAYSSRTVVGCTATAMAQLMKYWNYPTFGVGSHSYIPSNDYGELSADFGQTTYHWEHMPNTLQLFSSDMERRSVALLSYHCGVATEMSYGPGITGGSGAWVVAWGSDTIGACAENALRNYFKYDNGLHGENRGTFDDSTWTAMIDTDIANGRPILYTGYDADAGHAFVLDGADLQGRYHFNWGWSGYFNGFFYVDNLNPGGGGTGGNTSSTYNIGQQAIFNIKPGGVETFDTVSITDTVCSDESEYVFYEYIFPVDSDTYTVIHLDSVIYLTVKVMDRRPAYFAPNGAEGERQSIIFCPGDGIVMPDQMFERPGYRFEGWCLKNDASDSVYLPGQTVHISRSRTFYSIWRDSADVLGINLVDDALVSVWPNPATDELNVAFGCDVEGQLMLIDAMGRVVAIQNVEGGKAKFRISEMPAGTYMLQLNTSYGRYNRRIIKR